MRRYYNLLQAVCRKVGGVYGSDFDGPYCIYENKKVRFGHGKKYSDPLFFLMRYADLLHEKNVPFNPWPDPLHTGWLIDAFSDVIKLGKPEILPTQDDIDRWIAEGKVKIVTYIG